MERKYELLFLLNPSLNDKEVLELKKAIEKKIDGKVVKQEDWGKKELAYDIKKQKEAIYVLYYIEAKPENIEVLKKFTLIKKEILRELIIKHEKKWPFESKKLDLKKIKPYGKKRNNQ